MLSYMKNYMHCKVLKYYYNTLRIVIRNVIQMA